MGGLEWEDQKGLGEGMGEGIWGGIFTIKSKDHSRNSMET